MALNDKLNSETARRSSFVTELVVKGEKLQTSCGAFLELRSNFPLRMQGWNPAKT